MLNPVAFRRQPFLDIYRGYALLAITLNHFALVAHDAGLTEVHSFSLTPIGLSSAAEIFVLCSGYAFGLAYGRLLDRTGLLATSIKAIRRAKLLLICNFIMTVASAAIIVAGIPMGYRHAGSFEMANYVFSNFSQVLREMISLQWTPAYHDVLPLYALLLVLAPLQLYGIRRAPLITVALSTGAWLLAATGVVGTAELGLAGWYFNPMAWQFLFFIGMVASTRHTLERLPAGGRVILAYLLLLIAALAFKLAVRHGIVPTSLWLRRSRGGAVPLGGRSAVGRQADTRATTHRACPRADQLHGGDLPTHGCRRATFPGAMAGASRSVIATGLRSLQSPDVSMCRAAGCHTVSLVVLCTLHRAGIQPRTVCPRVPSPLELPSDRSSADILKPRRGQVTCRAQLMSD